MKGVNNHYDSKRVLSYLQSMVSTYDVNRDDNAEELAMKCSQFSFFLTLRCSFAFQDLDTQFVIAGHWCMSAQSQWMANSNSVVLIPRIPSIIRYTRKISRYIAYQAESRYRGCEHWKFCCKWISNVISHLLI